MSFEYIKKYYGISIELGQTIERNGRLSIVVEDRRRYVGVVFDGCKPTDVRSCHPMDLLYGAFARVKKLSKSKDYFHIKDIIEKS